MMETVVYELEEIEEVVARDVLILDGLRMTEEELKNRIFDMLESKGYDLGDRSKLEISYDGADSFEDGMSTGFEVKRKVTKEVPYKVMRDEVYQGEFLLDDLRMSEEQQREKIFDMMRRDGVEVTNPEELEIGYEGADSFADGISTMFRVFRVTKERLTEEEAEKAETISDESMSDLEELKALREKLNSIEVSVNQDDVEKIDELTRSLEVDSSSADAMEDDFRKELEFIDSCVKELRKTIKETEKEYEETFKALCEMTERQKESFESLDLLTDEELRKLMEQYSLEKLLESEKVLKMEKELKLQKKQLNSFMRRKNKIEKNILKAEALGLSVAEYSEITSTLKKKEIVNEILSRKGLEEIVSKKAADRTKEEKELLKSAKAEIEKEIVALQNSTEGMSVLGAIEALYSIDTAMLLTKKSRKARVKEQNLENMRQNVLLLPEKVANDGLVMNYVAGKAPEDMVEAIGSNEEEPEREEIFSGTLVLDNTQRTPEERIREMMKTAGVEASDDEIEIDYEGVTNEDGLSETQTTSFAVYKKKKKEQNPEEPKAVATDSRDENFEREEIFSGTLVLDNTQRTPEERIREMMKTAGVEASDDEIEIDYEGVTNEDGLSETQTTSFVVYKKKKKEQIPEGQEVTEEDVDHIEYTDDDVAEEIVIYNDLDNNKRYAKKYVFDRFNAEKHGEEVRIENRACYELDDEDYQFIVGNADNDYSPYHVEEREIHLGKTVEPEEEEVKVTSADTLERIVVYNDLDNNKRYAKKPVFDRFNAEKHGEEVRIENRACYELDDEDYQFIVGNADNDYSPYHVEEREIHLGKTVEPEEETKKNTADDNVEKIVIYVDLNDNGKRYAKNYVFTRFNAEKQGAGIKINNALCYQLTDEDAEYIIGNADNDYSPYQVEIVPVHLKKELDSKQKHDKVTLFRDVNDNGQIYASEEILRRFGITPSGSIETIEGLPCYKIDEDTDKKINTLAKKSDPIVDVQYKDVHLKKKKTPPIPTPKVKTEIITLFRDVNNNGQVYASEEVLRRFGITPSGDFEVINGLNCYKISREADSLINHIANESKNPKITVKYVDVKLKKKSANPEYRPHVETILDKLTTDLDIHAKDCKRYQASNIKVAKSFKSELQSGNIWYNIVHLVPSLAKIPFMLFRKLSGRLMTTKRAEDAMQELERRLDELSEEELEVLFEEYKGSQLKTDMNNQINGLILQRLRRYGLEKVSVLNDSIRDNYANLFALLGQIRAIEEQLENERLDETTRDGLVEQRSQLIERASGFVKQILIARKDANNLLSGGVHGLEEDFKAVATKLSYVGMRFAKKNDFDNELQHALGEYGEGLNTAISTGDDEAIVSNFMGLESCYYANTEIARSVFGNRSVGSKYYSPLAEQFDYRDDPFIRDVFTTVALTSAAISAVNAIRVHQIESQELLRQQQQEANNVNSANDTVMDYVHQTGQQIEGHRGTFQEGMQAQSHQDVLNSANTIERAELDMNNWSFGDSYHATDAQGHNFYNAFSDEVTSKIGNITTRYGNGTITSAQALQEMADVANGAQTTLGTVSGECLDILRTYAQSHPQFDLSAVQESMEYIVAHPDAIANMNQGMIDVTNLAGGLGGLSATHVTALSSLPSDMLSTLVCAASAAGLALNVSKTMEHKYGRNGYGNEVTDMMDEYVNGYDEDEDELEEEADTTHHR